MMRGLTGLGCVLLALSVGSCGDVIVPLGIDADASADADTCVFGEGDSQCDDGKTCTKDQCLADGQCSHTIRADVCVVDGVCYSGGDSNPVSVCQVCDLAASQVSWTNISCDDGNECTVDTCDAASGCASTGLTGTPCDDGAACSTDDLCAAGVCVATPCNCGGIDCSEGTGPCQFGECVNNACIVVDAAAGTACQPANSCVLGAFCDSGANCVGTWDGAECTCGTDADCDDGLACTNDTCDTATGRCDSAVVAGACKLADACAFAGQAHPSDACLSCQPQDSDTAWSAAACDDGDICTADMCNPATGDCESVVTAGCCNVDADCLSVLVGPCDTATCVEGTCQVAVDPAKESQLCDDENACTVGERCTSGSCSGGVPKTCPDPEVACTVAVCDAATGECAMETAPVGMGCDDGDPCTVADGCTGSGCLGQAKDCSVFGNDCSTSACDGVTGECVTTVNVGSLCNDSDECTTPDVCLSSGACQGLPDVEKDGCTCDTDADCDDQLACTIDSCLDPVCLHTASVGTCLITGVCYSGGEANPENPCQVCDPVASSQQWSSANCDDGNPCTDNTCHPVDGCVAVPNDTATCDDGDPCTEDDACAGGECTGYCECIEAADCPTTVAPACQKVACSEFKCVTVADSALEGMGCDDGLFCTLGETCQGGSCGGAGPRDCSASSLGQCIEGVCDDVANVCKGVPLTTGTACDDGDACTEGDGCSAGTCAGSVKDCSGLGDQCHVPYCDSTGTCQASVKLNEACSDGDACTLSDVCAASGNCVGAWDEDNCGCNDDAPCGSLSGACAVGRCDLANHQCYADPLTGSGCNDGNACTHSDACTSAGGCTGTPYTCETALSCETLTCDGSGGCTSVTLPGFCIIANTCVSNGTTNGANACQLCDSTANASGWTSKANGTSCNADSSGCTVNDSCTSGSCVAGSAPNCSDGKSCTNDSCQSLTASTYNCTSTVASNNCLISGTCYSNGAVNPLNACQRCAVGTSQSGWSNSPGGTQCGSQSNTACDDPNTCNGAGSCVDNYESSGTNCGAATECKAASNCNGTGTCAGGQNLPNGTVCTLVEPNACADCINGTCTQGTIYALCHQGGVGALCNATSAVHCRECLPGFVPCSICSGGPVPYVPGVAWAMMLFVWWILRRRRAQRTT